MRRAVKASMAALGAVSVLAGCSVVQPIDQGFYQPQHISGEKVDLKVGVLDKNLSNFKQTSSNTTAKCTLDTTPVRDAFITELRLQFREVDHYEKIEDCPDCDMFSIYDSSIHFGVVHGCDAKMSAEFVTPKKERIALVEVDKHAAFGQTHGAAIGMGILTGLSLFTLTPITLPIVAHTSCNRMQARAQEVYTEVIGEIGNAIRGNEYLTSESVRSGRKASEVQSVIAKPVDKYEELEKLKALYDKGIITKKEFNQEKRKILAK